eukprot:13400_1
MTRGRSNSRKRAALQRKQIEAAILSEPIDIEVLRSLARSGLADNRLRRIVWPYLLGCTDNIIQNDMKHDDLDEYPDREQVRKDIERSLHFDVTDDYSDTKRENARQSVKKIMDSIFSRNPNLHYLQGFHDICSVFFIVCGEHLGLRLTEYLSKQHIRDTLRPNLDAVTGTLSLLFPLLKVADKEVYKFIVKSEVEPFFALSWVTTWFAHNIRHFSGVTRIYDFFLASHPLMPLYFSISVIVMLKSDLLKLECEFSKVHYFFQNFPQKLDIDVAILTATVLFKKFPPKYLRNIESIDLPHDSPMWVDRIDEISPQIDRDYKSVALERRRDEFRRKVGYFTLALVPIVLGVLYMKYRTSS